MERDRTLDQRILDDARAQREQEEALARVAASRDVEVAKQQRLTSQSRHKLYAGVFSGLGGLLVLGIITGAIIWNTSESREQEERERRAETEIAEVCIREGNIWIDGDCLLTRRGE